jgi:hypothetical protein
VNRRRPLHPLSTLPFNKIYQSSPYRYKRLCITLRYCIALINALDYSYYIGSTKRPHTEDKKMIVMLIKRVSGQIGSEFIVDADGFAVEFKSESQIQNQIKMLKASDPTIIDFVIE